MSGKEAESKLEKSSGSSSRWMVVALLIAAGFFVFRFIAPQTLGEQARRHVEQTIRAHYPELEVSIGRGRIDPKVGLILSDIRFAVPDRTSDSAVAVTDTLTRRLGIGTPSSRPLLHIEQVVVVASANLQRLLGKQNPIDTRRILVNGLQANVWVNDAGTVSLESIWPPPKFGKVSCPRVEVRDAKFIIETESTTTRPLELELAEAVILKHPLAAGAIASEPGDQQSGSLNEQSQLPSTTISANGSASFMDHFGLHVTTVAGRSDIRAQLQGAQFSNQLIDRLPAIFRSKLEPFRGLELLTDTTAVIRVEPDQPINYKTRSKIHDGQFRHPRSSMPVKDIRGVLTCTPTGARIESCQAFWGESRLTLDGHTVGYNLPLEAHVDLSGNNLMLDERFAAIIPKRLEAGWKKFQPHGLIDIPEAHFDIYGDRIDTSAVVTCKGVDINYDKFPYPVRQLTGSLSLQDNRAKSDLISGRIGGRLVQFLFDVPTKPHSEEQRVFSAAMDGPIAIDGELLQALSPRGQAITPLESFIRSLNPMGAIHLVRGTMRTDSNGLRYQDVELRVTDGTLRYEKFPYPLYNVTGNVRIVDDQVSLSDFHGSNANGGLIHCEGHYRIPQRVGSPTLAISSLPGPSLVMDFDASRISLDEALRSSLPESSKQTWDNLLPSGAVDSIQLQLTQQGNGVPVELNVAARQFDAKRIGSDTLRLQPTALPYRLDITEAAVRFEAGQVFIDTIRAQHGRSLLSAEGGCQRLKNGRWLLKLDVHNGSRLTPDAELTNALPEQMRGAMRGLNLRGPVGLSGRTETLLSDASHPEPEFGWDLRLQLEGNRIGDVGPVHGLRGELLVKGTKNNQGISADGEVFIDSMHVNELQITRLRGPFQVRDDQLRLGGYGTANTFQNPIEGKLFDGTLRLDGNVKLSDASFNVRLDLLQAKVPVLLAELGQGKNDLTGTLIASMALEGLLGTTDLLRGRGRATVEDANLYQVPVLVQLLNVLSISPTEDVAFTNADLDFLLVEDEIVFNDLKLWGSLIALYGNGTLDRRKELDLTFNTRVSPRNMFTRILRPVVDQRYTLWTVDVKGPLDNPTIERKSLDAVGQTLERLFPGMNQNTALEPKRKDRSAGNGRMYK